MPTMKNRRRSAFASNKTVEVDDFGRNPLVEDYLQVAPHMSAHRATAPTLFATGDLPSYTASGNPPSALLNLPWQVRHAAAKADQAEWARIFSECADDAEYELMFGTAAHDPANDEYKQRVSNWAAGR